MEGDGEDEGEGSLEGDPDGEPLGEALGDADALGVLLHAPGRNGSRESLPQPFLTPAGWRYQSRMLSGSPLMKRFMIVSPTFSP